MPELWLPVVGYEGLYEVSDHGRVRGLPRQSASRPARGRILKHYIGAGTRGYPSVRLSRESKGRNYHVHILVLRAHVGPPAPGQEARHGPGGKTDASLANLCWGTRSENIRDRVRDGQDQRGERHGEAKLTWAAVADIRARRAAGERLKTLAAEYGVCFQSISEIARGERWQHPPA